MAILSHHWLFARRISAVALIGAVLAGAAAAVKGAPVTFVFDAQVTGISVPPSTDFDLPFSVAVGDKINGRFAFEPSPVGQIGAQSLGIQLDIDDITLHSPTYDIRIARNQFPPLGSVEVEPIDLISVACSFLGNQAQCNPGTVPGTDGVVWRPFMSLSGKSPILDSFDLIGNPSIWNAFTGRALSLHFASESGGASINAIVGPFVTVPELPSWQVALGLAVTILLTKLAATMGLWRSRKPS